jgi:hypothetical protein
MTATGSGREGFADMALLVRAFQVSKMLAVAASLELADRVQDGPKPVTTLAADCGADAAMLLRLCRALAAFGIFAVDAEGAVSQSVRSEWLLKDAKPTLHYAALYWTTPGSWTAWGHLEHAIRTGSCPFEEVFGQPMFPYLNGHPAEAVVFDRFMQHSPDARQAAVVEAYDFSGIRLVVDVGGGNGVVLNLLRLIVLSERRRTIVGCDLDPAWLELLRDFALQRDCQQAVLEARARDLHMISKAEALLEGAGGDAAMENLHALRLRMLLAVHEERAFLLDDLDLVRCEARDRHGDAVLIVLNLLDVVGRPSHGLDLVEHVEQTVEANRRAVERRKVERCSHSYILH